MLDEGFQKKGGLNSAHIDYKPPPPSSLKIKDDHERGFVMDLPKDDYAGWLIKKGHYYYRPNCQGYTGSKLDAGRYTRAQVDYEASHEPDLFTVELAPECEPDGIAKEIVRLLYRSS